MYIGLGLIGALTEETRIHAHRTVCAHRHNRHSCGHGFYPQLAAAKAKAQQTTCLNNLKQTGLAYSQCIARR